MDAINYLTVIFFVGKLQEKVPLSYTFNGTSFMYLAFLLTAVNALSFNMNKSQTRTFSPLFHTNKMHLLALWAFLQTKMTDFPPFYILQLTKSLPRGLTEVPLSGGASLFWPL